MALVEVKRERVEVLVQVRCVNELGIEVDEEERVLLKHLLPQQSNLRRSEAVSLDQALNHVHRGNVPARRDEHDSG